MCQRLMLDEMNEVLAEHRHALVARVGQRHLARAVRRQYDVLGRPERIALGDGFLGHDIERRASELVAIERFDERRLIDGVATAHVDDEGILRQHGQALPGEEVRRLARARQAEHEDIRCRQVLREMRLVGHLVVDGAALVPAAVDADNACGLEGLDALGIARADIARPDDRHAAVLDGTQRQIVLPLVAADDFRILRIPAHEHQRHHDEMLRDCHAVGTGGIREQAALRQNARAQHGIDARRHTAEPLEMWRGLRELMPAARRRRIQDIDIRHLRQGFVLRREEFHFRIVLRRQCGNLLAMRFIHERINYSNRKLFHMKGPPIVFASNIKIRKAGLVFPDRYFVKPPPEAFFE